MKANELMIGDWIEPHQCRIPTVYARVEGIYPDGITIDKAERVFSFDEIHPIPLTPEILEKNGFEVTRNMSSSRNKDVWSLRVSKHKIFHIIEHHNKKMFPYFWIEIGSNSDIKYVHQLQHALRLCGIKKEIML